MKLFPAALDWRVLQAQGQNPGFRKLHPLQPGLSQAYSQPTLGVGKGFREPPPPPQPLTIPDLFPK